STAKASSTAILHKLLRPMISKRRRPFWLDNQAQSVVQERNQSNPRSLSTVVAANNSVEIERLPEGVVCRRSNLQGMVEECASLGAVCRPASRRISVP